MNKPDPSRLISFWESFQDLYMTLYGSRLACVAAIEGYAMAGGCMLSLSCDYRVMAMTGEKERPTIGLNETKLGIAAPSWLANQLVDTIGLRKAELSLQLGQLYSPEEALQINLVDEIVPKQEVKQRAGEVLQTLIMIPSQARYASKMLIRGHRIDSLKLERQRDTDFFVNFVTEPTVQKKLSDYLTLLAAKRKK
jgi:Delta3-Delta2-enoyl-CoA isomerase